MYPAYVVNKDTVTVSEIKASMASVVWMFLSAGLGECHTHTPHSASAEHFLTKPPSHKHNSFLT